MDTGQLPTKCHPSEWIQLETRSKLWLFHARLVICVNYMQYFGIWNDLTDKIKDNFV